jgi:hypothetical protein
MPLSYPIGVEIWSLRLHNIIVIYALHNIIAVYTRLGYNRSSVTKKANG